LCTKIILAGDRLRGLPKRLNSIRLSRFPDLFVILLIHSEILMAILHYIILWIVDCFMFQRQFRYLYMLDASYLGTLFLQHDTD